MKKGYNTRSPYSIFKPIDGNNQKAWLDNELDMFAIAKPLRDIIHILLSNEDEFIKWPSKAMLLWEGSDRVADSDKKQKYHKLTENIKNLSKAKKVLTDTRGNGPAKMAYLFADGERPKRKGSTNDWTIHHLYFAKFDYPEPKTTSLAAVKSGLHFTQTAGIVAVHPVMDALFDEVQALTWLFRYKAFERFGYDPMLVFSNSSHDNYGFCNGKNCEIFNY